MPGDAGGSTVVPWAKDIIVRLYHCLQRYPFRPDVRSRAVEHVRKRCLQLVTADDFKDLGKELTEIIHPVKLVEVLQATCSTGVSAITPGSPDPVPSTSNTNHSSHTHSHKRRRQSEATPDAQIPNDKTATTSNRQIQTPAGAIYKPEAVRLGAPNLDTTNTVPFSSTANSNGEDTVQCLLHLIECVRLSPEQVHSLIRRLEGYASQLHQQQQMRQHQQIPLQSHSIRPSVICNGSLNSTQTGIAPSADMCGAADCNGASAGADAADLTPGASLHQSNLNLHNAGMNMSHPGPTPSSGQAAHSNQDAASAAAPNTSSVFSFHHPSHWMYHPHHYLNPSWSDPANHPISHPILQPPSLPLLHSTSTHPSSNMLQLSHPFQLAPIHAHPSLTTPASSSGFPPSPMHSHAHSSFQPVASPATSHPFLLASIHHHATQQSVATSSASATATFPPTPRHHHSPHHTLARSSISTPFQKISSLAQASTALSNTQQLSPAAHSDLSAPALVPGALSTHNNSAASLNLQNLGAALGSSLASDINSLAPGLNASGHLQQMSLSLLARSGWTAAAARQFGGMVDLSSSPQAAPSTE